VLKMNPPEELIADQNTIITPAAKDKAFFKGINIIYRPMEKRKNDPISKITTSLDDGDYLLQKRGNNVRLYHIKGSGVFPVSND